MDNSISAGSPGMISILTLLLEIGIFLSGQSCQVVADIFTLPGTVPDNNSTTALPLDVNAESIKLPFPKDVPSGTAEVISNKTMIPSETKFPNSSFTSAVIDVCSLPPTPVTWIISYSDRAIIEDGNTSSIGISTVAESINPSTFAVITAIPGVL